MTSQELTFREFATFATFATFAATLGGNEKGKHSSFAHLPARILWTRWQGLPEGSRFEYRVRFPGDKTKDADLGWTGRVLLEMKSCGKEVSLHRAPT